MTIGRLENAGGNAGGVIIACLWRYFLFQQPARRLEIQHEDLRLQQGRLYPLAFARHLSFEQCGEDAQGTGQPGAQVGDRHPGAHGALAGQPGDGHQPAHALGDLIEPWAAVVGTVLSEPGDAAVDQPRVDGAQRFVIHPQPVLDVRAVVFNYHVGLLDQSLEQFQAFGGLQVEGNALLVAVQVLEIGTQAWATERVIAFHGLGKLDLDGVGAPVGQLPHTGRPGPHPGEVQYGESRKGQGAIVGSHGVSL